ncbi:unnamed protein product [Hydatigera taeniaeformis]|uniref:BHLH domain-containing protein n=1 Tax=Hydatigena taeniaeformis TaxID=6205 RepID=A0A0R3WY51_HYDTA|nr:unnamed protein product [Hydatigera taeniaeformis]
MTCVIARTYAIKGNKSGGGGNGPSASARVYDEMEAEKRVRKRRMRLLLAVEDAFAHAARMGRETTAIDASGALNRSSVVGTGGGPSGFTAFQNGLLFLSDGHELEISLTLCFSLARLLSNTLYFQLIQFEVRNYTLL